MSCRGLSKKKAELALKAAEAVLGEPLHAASAGEGGADYVGHNKTASCFYASEIAGLAEKEGLNLNSEADRMLLESRIAPLSQTDYLRALVVGLPLIYNYRSTDFGTTRQRDFGQMLGDAMRGALGEIAFAKLWKRTTGREIYLDARRLSLEEALESDVLYLQKDGTLEETLKISIKTTKFGGVWLDVPYAQVGHSDVFVLMKLAIPPDHLLRGLTSIEKVREGLLDAASGYADDPEPFYIGLADAVQLFAKRVRSYTYLPPLAYFSGFVTQKELKTDFNISEAEIKTTKSRAVIQGGIGRIPAQEHGRTELLREAVCGAEPAVCGQELPLEFEGIGSFSRAEHYIAHTRRLNKDLRALAKIVEAVP